MFNFFLNIIEKKKNEHPFLGIHQHGSTTDKSDISI